MTEADAPHAATVRVSVMGYGGKWVLCVVRVFFFIILFWRAIGRFGAAGRVGHAPHAPRCALAAPLVNVSFAVVRGAWLAAV